MTPLQLTARSIRVTVLALTLVTLTAPVWALSAPAAASAPQTASLATGARGDDVTALQRSLVAAGLMGAPAVVGIFGPQTAAAVREFQQLHGLEVTGEADAATLAALSSAGSQEASASSLAGLSAGAQGPAVVELQRALIATGLVLAGGADGIFGAATTKAVIAVQGFNQLPRTGSVDARTASVLAEYAKTTTSSTPTVTPPSSGPATLKAPMRGAAVADLQRMLIAAGVAVFGGADGVFGPATSSSVQVFQRSAGLAVTGIADAATIDGLRSASSKPTGTTTLRQGATGSAVADLQRALIRTGLSLPGGADGVFGAVTSSVLSLFQRTNGLPVTGSADAETLKLLGAGSDTTPTPAPGFAVFGERGERTVLLQRALIASGVSFTGGADGVFGSMTSGAVMSFQRTAGLRVTGVVDASTAAKLSLQATDRPSQQPKSPPTPIVVFPVEPACWYGDTWLAPRAGARLHQGTDLIAPAGAKLFAAATGTVARLYVDSPGSLTGNGVKITTSDGTSFFYAHMASVDAGISVGSPVQAGTLLGTVGMTGNAGTPHLHFEVHAPGGVAVNPFPLLHAFAGSPRC